MTLPSFSLPGSDGENYTEKDLSQGTVVLYFYPKDNTPGCTQEAQDFRDLQKKFAAQNIRIFGVSPDTIKKHENFIKKHDLSFVLLSDEERVLIEGLELWVEKTLYGRKYFGVNRSTFLLQEGEIIAEWKKVKVTGHAEEVLERVKKI